MRRVIRYPRYAFITRVTGTRYVKEQLRAVRAINPISRPPEKFFRLNPHISALIRTYPHLSAPFPEFPHSAFRNPHSAVPPPSFVQPPAPGSLTRLPAAFLAPFSPLGTLAHYFSVVKQFVTQLFLFLGSIIASNVPSAFLLSFRPSSLRAILASAFGVGCWLFDVFS